MSFLKTPAPGQEPPYHPIWDNFEFLFLTNFKLIPFFLPSIVALGLFLAFGGGLFLLAALLLLIPAGPAVSAMYDMSYYLIRQVPKYERRTFFRSYRANFRQGCATMAVMLPILASLLLVMMVEGDRPVWVMLCLVLGCVMLMAFAILAFSQIALAELSLTQIWKNSVLLIPLTHWRSLLPAVCQLMFLAVLYNWASVAFLGYLFLGPAMILAWSATVMWPALEQLLVKKEA